MNLHAMLLERQAAGRPVTVGLSGAGKFGTMFASQVRLTDAMHLVALADLDVSRARRQLRTAGWSDEAISAPSLGNALARGITHVTEDTEALIACPEIEVIVEATGVPAAGIRHALSAIRHGKHIVMVNVEADALAGPLLARKAKTTGVVYSLTIIAPRPIPCGTFSTNICRSPTAIRSIQKCSTASSTAPSRALR